MYGLLLESIVLFIKKAYSEEKWQEVRKAARLDQETFNLHQVYAETIIPKLIDATQEQVGLPKEDILMALGRSFPDFLQHYG